MNQGQKLRKVHISFDNNDHALRVFGPGSSHLNFLKDNIPVTIRNRGNEVTLEGTEIQVKLAERCLNYLRKLIERGETIEARDLKDCLRVLSHENQQDNVEHAFQKKISVTKNKVITTRTIGQKRYVEAIERHDIVFGVGPAGTGKTYLAMAACLQRLLAGEVGRIVLTRPAVEAGERLGFLPGDLVEKIDPYLRPLYDAIYDMVDAERAGRLIESGQIEIAPLAFMRGRTLDNSCVILDEAQNCTREQMKMFLTRLGDNSRAIITGDITQIDLPKKSSSGLIQAARILDKVEGIHIHFFSDRDVVRHHLVAEIIRAYERAAQLP